MVNLAEKFSSLKDAYTSTLATLTYVEKKIKDLKKEQEEITERQSCIDKARIIIQEIGHKTQQNLEFHVSSLVTTAIKHVDITWPDYVIEFVKRRNKLECDIYFSEKGRKQHPLDSAGFGAVDVGAFTNEIGYWTLNKNRPTFFRDEPFRNVSPDLQYKVSEMLKMICEEIHLQILMVSHAEDINVAANKTFLVEQTEGVSQIKEV